MEPGSPGRATRDTDRFIYRPATPADDPDLRALLRELPVGGEVEVAFECEPSVLEAGAIEGRPVSHVVMRERATGKLAAMLTRAVRPVYINGQPVPAGYMGQFRVAPGFHRSLRATAGAVPMLRSTWDSTQWPWDLAVIPADNLAAQRILESGARGMLKGERLEKLVSSVLPTRQRARVRAPAGLTISAGTAADIPMVAECLARNGPRYNLTPAWTAADLTDARLCRGLQPADFVLARRGPHVAGCLAVWDQRAFRQVVVRGYSPRLRRLRPWVNLVGPMLGIPYLPRPGTVLRQAYLSHLAVDDDAPGVLLALVAEALRRARSRDLDALSVGLAERNPMLPLLRRNFLARRYVTMLYAVPIGEAGSVAGHLDGRPPQPEIAVL